MISLKKATIIDCDELYDLQIKSFKLLLEKYKDYDFSPGAETIEKTISRLKESFIDYYFICIDNKNIGALRVANFNDLCKLKQIFIIPEYQDNGYAQQAITLAEELYSNIINWEVDTIKQEEKLCYLYEKMGYRRTGKEKKIKEGMDIVYFDKNNDERDK